MPRYLGQCDVLRRGSAANERRWQAMMQRAQRVPFKVFLSHVDLSPLLDEGETPHEYLADAKRMDPTTAAYRSWWGRVPAWFLQTAGFEFIFLD